MNDQPAAQLWLEPGRFRGHDVPAVGNVDQLFHRDRVEGECNGHFTAVNPFFQFSQSPDAADEVNALVPPQVLDA